MRSASLALDGSRAVRRAPAHGEASYFRGVSPAPDGPVRPDVQAIDRLGPPAADVPLRSQEPGDGRQVGGRSRLLPSTVIRTLRSPGATSRSQSLQVTCLWR